MKLILLILSLYAMPFYGQKPLISKCVSGDCKDGKGKLEYSNGDSYEGEFNNGLKEGFGIEASSNGYKYEGQFKLGSKHGYGTLIYSNGNTYKGKFKYGVRNGKGVLIDKSGDIIHNGKWKKDKFLK